MTKEEQWTNSLQTSGDQVHVLDYYYYRYLFLPPPRNIQPRGIIMKREWEMGRRRKDAGENMRVIGKISSYTLIIFALVHSRVAL